MAQDMRALRDYVTAMDGHQYENVPEGVVCLLITHSNLKLQMVDIRLNCTAPSAKYGTSCTSTQALNQTPWSCWSCAAMERMRLHVVDKDPFSLSKGGGLEDVSLIKKYEISEEDYNKREKTVRAYKKEQLAKDPNWKPKTMMNAAKPAVDPATLPGPETVANMKVGDRCEVQPGGRRGQVQYLGEIPEIAPGYWVGVQFDEPVGKGDGSVKGATYFKCEDKYGGFVRPHNVAVGDFPMLDPFADLSDSDDDEL
ncbi:CAP Gly-rich domain [Phytophthora cactorum]|nr:CAP Gly-rich domain [Phytophthora cactorum]